MADASALKLTVRFTNPDLDAEDKDREVQRLFDQLKNVDEIDRVQRVLDPSPPLSSKALGGFLVDTLATEIRPGNLQAVLGFLGDRLAHKSVELELELDGRKIKLKANSQQDLILLLPAIQQFMNGQNAGPLPSAPASSAPQSASPAALSEPVSVFFSYSHKDEDLRDELATHLTMLKRQGLIASWYDREISAGTDWAGAIDEHLKQAKLVLLLISANFLASDYCYDMELKQALERHRAGVARVIPIILKPSDWTHASFGHLQALPKNAQPITTWENRDEAFLSAVQGIRAIIQQMTALAAIH